MRVAVECQSPLLQKSLEIFLAKYLGSAKHCDIVVRDSECLNDERCFYISADKKADLVKPFSKSQLILALESKYATLKKDQKIDENSSSEEISFDILEKRIEYLTREYQQNVINAIKAFYEK